MSRGTDCCGDCASGKFNCECCCSSVTLIKGGIHPDSMESVSKDLVLEETSLTRTHRAEVLLQEPVHIIGADVSLITIKRDTNTANSPKQVLSPTSAGESRLRSSVPASVSLYSIPGYAPGDLDKGGFNAADAEEQSRRYFSTCSLTAHNPHWTAHEDLFGFFVDGGLFVELNAPTTEYGVRVVVRYVPRLQFSPAYHDPLEVMQHYWKCSRGDTEFLEGFYGGTSLSIPSNDSTPIASTEQSTGNSWSSIAESFSSFR